jgi:rhodanese-related sulfurtransferase
MKKGEMELRSQNSRLGLMIKNLAKKLVSRLPISIESLEKGLGYDLIFSAEIDAWKAATSGGTLLDIRPSHDYLKASIPGSFNIPVEQLSMRLDSLPRERAILIVCENGIKSVAASELLSSKGYSFLYVLKGGLSMYEGEIEQPRAVREADSAFDGEVVELSL